MQFNKELKSASAAYIMGFSPMVKVTGASNKINTFSEVLESSRVVYELLQGNATIEMISEALAAKSEKANLFTKATGHNWPF